MKNLTYFILFSVITYVFATKDLMFEKFELVPDILDKAPTGILQVVFGAKKVELGNELTPAEVKDQPTITWNADPDTYYTLLMVDPDAPSRVDFKFREVKHWFVGNIKGNDVAKGEHITQFIGSGPPKGTGLHRYVFLLYKQNGKINYDEEPRTSNVSRDHRFMFSTRKFVEKYNLGVPVAGNFYQAQWDTYVDERNKKLAELMAKDKQ